MYFDSEALRCNDEAKNYDSLSGAGIPVMYPSSIADTSLAVQAVSQNASSDITHVIDTAFSDPSFDITDNACSSNLAAAPLANTSDSITADVHNADALTTATTCAIADAPLADEEGVLIRLDSGVVSVQLAFPDPAPINLDLIPPVVLSELDPTSIGLD